MVEIISNLSSTVKKHKRILFIFTLILISVFIYLRPQSFVNIWLTRDQQAMYQVKNGDYAKASRTFTNRNWIAYSFYKNGDYQQAISIYKKLEGLNALFSLGNSYFHINQYYQAIGAYEKVLKIDSTHKESIENIKLAKKLISGLKKTRGKKELTTEIDKNRKAVSVKKKTNEEQRESISNKMWLKQVQQNPSEFLRRKFKKEHDNANKN